jgi:hypothetical protein
MGISQTLRSRGLGARIVPDFLGESASTTWRIESERSSTRLVLEDGTVLSEKEISAVFVQRPRFAVKEGWKVDDAVYIHAEKEAALLGWIWSLPCPVINRYPAELWFEPTPSPLYWSRQLEMCGLNGADVEAPRQDQSSQSNDIDWSTRCYSAAIIGSQVVWDENVALSDLDARLVQFAKLIGLTCIGCEFLALPGLPKINAKTFPTFDRFCSASQGEIIERIADLMVNSLNLPGEDKRPSSPQVWS